MSEFSNPPRRALKLLRFYCSEERLEEIEGDLCEVYNEFIRERGKKYSKIFYWWLVVKNFRSYALKRKKMKNKGLIDGLFMFLKHNILITWRNLLKHKNTSVINIAGLAIGIASFLSIYTIVQYELSFNKEVPDANRIYRITSSFSGSFKSTNRGVAVPVSGHVKETFTGMETVSPFHNFSAKVSIYKEDVKEDMGRQRTIILADESYFDLVSLDDWIVGSKESMRDPFKVVLTASQAEKYFGNKNYQGMMDKEIIYRDSLKVYVSGIVRAPEYANDFGFTEFISYPSISASWLKERFGSDDWSSTNSSSQLFIKLHPESNYEDVLSQMDELDKYVQEQNEGQDWIQSYNLQPLADLHYNQDFGIFDYSGSSTHKPTLTVLSIVAIFLLLIAVFNFINLETVQSTNKSKEVGVRKVLGSGRFHLVGRFLTESVLITFFAVIISIPLAHYGLIFFDEFVPEGAVLRYQDIGFWFLLILLTFGVGLLAGAYPSWITSSFVPIKALKSGFNLKSTSMRGSWLRKALISFQFLFSQLLIVVTFAVVLQISFMLDKELGFEEEGVIYLFTPWYETDEKKELLLNEIARIPEVQEISMNGAPPVQNGYSTNTVKYQKGEDELMLNPHQKSGDTSYLHFYGIELLAGTNLRPNESANEMLINETFMKDLGFEMPRDVIGLNLELNKKDYRVVGVMEDFHFRSMHHPIQPLMLRYNESNRCIAMKAGSGDQLERTIDKLTEKWDAVYGEIPLTINFMDETVSKFYESERKTSKLASLATGLAIFISCLGLIGLISFTIVQKSKEMGIRKVLGASVLQIGSILSREFVILILVSFAIATPLSYFAISKWLEDFAYQTEISWWVYGLGGLASVIIALASIFAKVWKASTSNPIESLRYE